MAINCFTKFSKNHVIAFAFLSCHLISYCDTGSQSPKEMKGRESMKVHINLNKSKFFNKEDAELEIQISNSGTSDISIQEPAANTNSQPEYSLIGPSYPNGYKFSFRSLVEENGMVIPDAQPYLVNVPAGNEYQSQFSLGTLLDFPIAGKHELSLRFVSNNVDVKSNTVQFEVFDLKIDSCVIGSNLQGNKISDLPPIYCLTQKDTQDVGLVKFNLNDQTGVASLNSISFFGIKDISISQIVPTQVNYSGIGTPANRVGFRHSEAFRTIGFDGKSEALQLPSQSKVIAPILGVKEGQSYGFAYEEQKNELNFFTVAHSSSPTPPPIHIPNINSKLPPETDGDPKLKREPVEPSKRNIPEPIFPPSTSHTVNNAQTEIVWKNQIDINKLLASKASLHQNGSPVQFTVMLIGTKNKIPYLYLVSLKGASASPTISSIRLDGYSILNNSEPALKIDDSDNIKAFVILESTATKKAVGVELNWKPGQEILLSTRTEPLAEANNFLSSTANFNVDKSKVTSLIWAIMSKDGQVLGSHSANFKRLQNTPLTPLKVFKSDNTLYVLTKDKHKGLAAEVL